MTTAVEKMQSALDAIERHNARVNAVISLADPNDLMKLAEAADQVPMEQRGALHGEPIAIKDLANAAGFETSMGSPIFKNNLVKTDDIMVARMRAAGAIIIGKTNTPEFGLGSHTFNPVHGATGNAYDATRSAGGSSGGAAVALATGDDALCGWVGHDGQSAQSCGMEQHLWYAPHLGVGALRTSWR
jgi:amidase